MKLINCQFKSKDELELFIDANIKDVSGSILIQVFSGDLNIDNVQQVLDTLKSKLPHAKIIGCSTAGEIVSGVLKDKTIQISFSLFEKTNLGLFYYPETNFISGENAANEGVSSNTKAVIAFSEALKGKPELFLEGFSSKIQNIPISGGNAGDNLLFEKTFLICDDKIYFEGIVLCSLDSDSLHVYTNYSFNSVAIGAEMIVTKAVDNVIYEIDYTPVHKIYQYYLGDSSLENFPLNLIEFPLVRIDEEVSIARTVVSTKEDGGFIYTGHFKNGDKVKFAIVNGEKISSKAHDLYESMISNPVEASYVYSCASRKMFLKKGLEYELGLIEKIASSIGFITYGEFFHSKIKNQLLTITTTTLSLSETDIMQSREELPEKINNTTTMLNSLVHLVNISDKNLNQYKKLLDKSSIVSKADTQGYIIYVNDKFCKISGYSREELIGKKHSIVRHPDNSRDIFRDMWNTITSKKIWKGTIRNRAKDGSTYYVKTLIMPVLDDYGHIISYIASRTNVTELIKKDKIIKQQYKDKLTGLQNRNALIDKLENANEDITLILINIDRFSDINDYYGYEKGDRTLEHFASVLKSRYSAVFRISGDEFAILCEHPLDKETKKMIAELIIDLENEEYKMLADKATLLLSCGVAHGANNEIYNFAHIALKENRKDNKIVTFFNDNMNLYNKIEENIKVIASIKDAILNDTFVPFYQGIVDNKTKKITKYECLIRLKEENGKVLTPYFFLEHSKKAKLYYKLTMIMIKKSFEKFADNRYEFSINFTLQDIQSVRVVRMLIEYLELYKCGSRLVIEIVESEGIENFDELSVFIKQIKRYGCKVAIDDFGTGYSNFNYLSKLDVDYIKIDGSLIKNIDNDPSQLATVESILLFAKKMNIQTIAEFVETKNIYDILNDLGVDFSQGYYFSKPQEELVNSSELAQLNK